MLAVSKPLGEPSTNEQLADSSEFKHVVRIMKTSNIIGFTNKPRSRNYRRK